MRAMRSTERVIHIEVAQLGELLRERLVVLLLARKKAGVLKQQGLAVLECLRGRHGLGLLSLGATSQGGFNALASNWAIAEGLAADHGRSLDRSAWRLVGPMHLAENKDQAIAEVRFDPEEWLSYFR